jgi:sugar fermentation stimulation protein A
MLFPQPLKRGVLVRRYKRFLADVLLDGEELVTVHTPNPGGMLGLCAPGMTVWCSRSAAPSRKLPLTWELVEADGGLVGVNTLAPNALVAEALAGEPPSELAGYPSVRREVRFGTASRADFLLQASDAPDFWLEVKNCHLSRGGGLAEFPDCVAARSARHAAELALMARSGSRAALLFVVQRTDCDRFAPARDLDPAFAAALGRAVEAGVEVFARVCEISLTGVRLAHAIPVIV